MRTKFEEEVASIIYEATKSGTIWEKDQYYPIIKYSYYVSGGQGRSRTEGIKNFLAVITPIGEKDGYDTPKEAGDVMTKFQKKIEKAKDGKVAESRIIKGGQVEAMIKAMTGPPSYASLVRINERKDI